MQSKLIEEIAEFTGLSVLDIKTILSKREELVELEATILTNAGGLDFFYKKSNFMLFSNAQDEIERDADTDWDDMHHALKELTIKSVLDFGCGIGSAGLHCPADWFIFTEPNEIARLFLEFRCDRRSLDRIIVSSLNELKQQGLKVDLIVAWGVFEHIPDDKAAVLFEDLKRFLNPGGRFFLKNFYGQTNDYLRHFDRGSRMQEIYETHKEIIIYAKHSN